MHDSRRNANAAERLRPEFVLWSRRLADEQGACARELEAADAPTWLVGENPDNRDALHGRTRSWRMSLPAFAAQLPQATDPNGYERLWASF